MISTFLFCKNYIHSLFEHIINKTVFLFLPNMTYTKDYALLAEPKRVIFSLTVALIASVPGEQAKNVNDEFCEAKSTKQGVVKTEDLRRW